MARAPGGRFSPLRVAVVLAPIAIIVAGVASLTCSETRDAPSAPTPSGTGTVGPTATPVAGASDVPTPTGEPLHYVALGDSLAAAGQREASYVPAFARHLEQASGRPADVVNAARSGWTLSDLLAAVRGDAEVRAALARAEVVTLNGGGNDLLPLRVRYGLGTCGGRDGEACLRRGVERFVTQWEALLDEVIAVRGGSDGVGISDLYHPFVAAEQQAGTYPVTRSYLDAANRRLRAAARRRGVRVAAVHEAFNGPEGREDAGRRGFVGIDGVHPTVAGAAAIAGAFAALELAPEAAPVR